MLKWFRYTEYEDKMPEVTEPPVPPVDKFAGMTEGELRERLLEKVIAHLEGWNEEVKWISYGDEFGQYRVSGIPGSSTMYISKTGTYKSTRFTGVDAARIKAAADAARARHTERENIKTLKEALR